MRELMNVTFESGVLPQGWWDEGRWASFERGCLRSGRAALLRFMLPGKGWDALRIEMDLEPVAGACVELSDRTVHLVSNCASGTHSVMYYGGAALAQTVRPCTPRDGRYLVEIEVRNGRWSATVNGEETVSAPDPRPTPFAGLVELGVWDDCLVRSIRLLGEGAHRRAAFPVPARRSRSLFLEVNVDFPDDLMHAPFTRDMFDQLFAEFRSWNVRRCHWIHYGPTSEHWWLGVPHGMAENYERTVQNLGGEVFPEAVRAAHAHGVEIYGMFKPFDMGFWHSVGEGTEAARQMGRLDRIGGPIVWAADFVAQRRDLIMARKPGAWGDARNQTFTRIELVKEDAAAAAFTVRDVRLFVSDDNATYRPYQGPIAREERVEDYPVWEHTPSGGRPTGQSRRSRVMRLGNLDLRSRYFIIAVPSRAESFANSFINLVHVFGDQGEERMLTYAIKVREGRHTPEGAGTKELFDGKDPKVKFADLGLEYDCWPGTPTAVFPGFDAIRSRYVFDAREGLIGVARGKDPNAVATLSPFYPEARAWWLSWLRECLDAGADGLELRYRHHHSPFAWAEFGFEKPVRDEFLRRHGVDLWATDDFDRVTWRRLRGEAYTEFYREASRLARGRGKPIGIHMEQNQCVEPEQGASMEMHLDWRTWIDEGLADSVTLKEIWPRSRFADEVLSRTRARRIPAIFCPYANGLWRLPGGERIVAGWIRLARENGCDGYQFYECAAVVRATPQGRIVMEQPALREVFQREFPR